MMMPNANIGHGHVTPRPDGAKAKCGGPALCPVCAEEARATALSLPTGIPAPAVPAVRADEYDEIWLCADGRRLRVCDMGEEHVRATLNMILRNRRRRRELRRELKALELFTDELVDHERKWGKS